MSLIKDIVRCAITEDAVQKFQKLYNDKNNIEIGKTQALWLLGFDTTKGEVELKNHRVRSQLNKYETFETYVYHGFLRNNLKTEKVTINGETRTIPMVDSKGNLCYTSQSHPFRKMYEQNEIVTFDVIPKEVQSILEIGTIRSYNGGDVDTGI